MIYVLWNRWRRGPVPTPFAQVTKELEVIRAGAEVERVRAELGHTEALKHIDDKYAKELKALEEAQQEEATRLREDPEALARFIIRGANS